MDDLILNFEAQAQIDKNGVQFWLARDLQTLSLPPKSGPVE